MAAVVLVHSSLGLDDNIRDWQRWLEGRGHYVDLVELYEGQTFTSTTEAVQRAVAGDFVQYVARVRAAVREAAGKLRGPLVLMGFSLGAYPAQIVAMTEPGVRGVVLCWGALAPSWFGNPAWPAQLRAQFHYAPKDPWIVADEVAGFISAVPLVAQVGAPGPELEVWEYEGEAHFPGFPHHGDYDAATDAVLRERLEDFLAGF